MKRIYFVQANDVYGTDKKSVYLPYAVGCIQAYCQKSKIINENYSFGKFIYTKRPVKDVVAELENPYMVLFSVSVWNTEYNKALAKEIKKAYPQCLICFGGHNISSDGADLEKNKYIDFLTHRFGEEPTRDLLEALQLGIDLKTVANLSFRDENSDIITTEYEPQTATDYPSPYLEDTFSEILKDDISFSGLFESNRGCPNGCAFCDWSSLKSKVRLFPMERVYKEIDWFVENKIEYIYCVDANFCLFDRDADIANYIVECKEKYGYPCIFKIFFTKNRFNFVFDVSTRFFRSGLDKAKTVSFQSMNPRVLENIGRKNISVDFFRDLMKKYNEMNIPTFSELILGLPGETYDSFCEGVGTLVENGQHYAINIYPCELLPNSRMGQRDYKEKYSIKSTRVPFKLIHSNESHEGDTITEYSEYITSTYSMNEEEWARALLFANYVQGLHNLGLLRVVAIYCRHELNISYNEFYNRLIEYSEKQEKGLLKTVYSRVNSLCKGIITSENELVSTCDGLGDVLWGFDELIYLEFFKDLKKFYREIEDFASSELSAVLSELINYQHSIIKKIGSEERVIEADYDFYSYFSRIYSDEYAPLEKKKITLHITDNTSVNSFEEYAREIVWYGRNRRATDYTSNCYNIEYTKN